AVGECAQHRGRLYGLVDPVYEQARVLADVLTGAKPDAAYAGSRLGTTLKVMGVDLTSMGDVAGEGPDCEVVSHLDPGRGVYKKLVVRDGRLAGAILLGTPDTGGRLLHLFKRGETLPGAALELLHGQPDGPVTEPPSVHAMPDDQQVCNCNTVPKGTIV